MLASVILLNRRREGEASKVLEEHIDVIGVGTASDDIKVSL